MELENQVKDLEAQLSKLSSKNSEILDELKAERKKRQQLDDEVEAEKKRIKELEDEEAQKKANDSGDMEALKASYESKIKSIQDGFIEEEQKLKGQLKKVTVESTAQALASDLAIDTDSALVLLPHIRSRLSLDSESARVVVLSEQGELSASSLDDFKSELKGTACFARNLRSSDASGGGAGGANGGGAATKKFSELSESERTQLHRENPEQYRKLRDKHKGI